MISGGSRDLARILLQLAVLAANAPFYAIFTWFYLPMRFDIREQDPVRTTKLFLSILQRRSDWDYLVGEDAVVRSAK